MKCPPSDCRTEPPPTYRSPPSARGGLAALVTTEPGRTHRSPPSARGGLAALVTTEPGRTHRSPPSARGGLAAPASLHHAAPRLPLPRPPPPDDAPPFRPKAAPRPPLPSGAPGVPSAPPFFDHPLFVEAVADRARAALARVPPSDRDATPLVFTAHSVPTAMADSSPYVADFSAASSAVAKRLQHGPWRLAYQSRSGSPLDPWLEPDVNDVLEDLGSEGARHVVIVPIDPRSSRTS